MPEDSHSLDGASGETSRTKVLLACTREIITASKELLAVPVPSTFLGRKSFEPYPKEDEQGGLAGGPPEEECHVQTAALLTT